MKKTGIAILAGAVLFAAAPNVHAQFQPPGSLGALAPANMAKPRPKAPFDLTGMWLHAQAADNDWRFPPPAGAKMTPDAQKHFDAAAQAAKEGKVYHDDIGQCWPAGVPLIMTRVWPIAMIQLPTAVYMISEFMNSLRVIYTDGRAHTDPDIAIGTFNGESIGKWEGDTLVVDTKYFAPDHHWVNSGVPASDQLHVIERIRMINEGKTLSIEYAMTDPKSWEGEWKWTKRWNRVDDRDIAEVECLPDLNEHMPTTHSNANVR
jgi:hypothetical protein